MSELHSNLWALKQDRLLEASLARGSSKFLRLHGKWWSTQPGESFGSAPSCSDPPSCSARSSM